MEYIQNSTQLHSTACTPLLLYSSYVDTVKIIILAVQYYMYCFKRHFNLKDLWGRIFSPRESFGFNTLDAQCKSSFYCKWRYNTMFLNKIKFLLQSCASFFLFSINRSLLCNRYICYSMQALCTIIILINIRPMLPLNDEKVYKARK